MASFALILTASILGAMLFFALFVAPAAAKAGSSAMVILLSRAVFPRAFDAFAICTALATAAAAMADRPFAAAYLMIATSAFLLAGWKITPALESARDKARAGDKQALLQFAKYRSSAVTANAIQYIALFGGALFLSF